jgi:hypothetical protein
LWTAAALGCAEQSFGQASNGQTSVKVFARHHTSNRGNSHPLTARSAVSNAPGSCIGMGIRSRKCRQALTQICSGREPLPVPSELGELNCLNGHKGVTNLLINTFSRKHIFSKMCSIRLIFLKTNKFLWEQVGDYRLTQLLPI